MPIFQANVDGVEQLKSIRLGSVDDGAKPANVRDFFKRYHADFFHSTSMAKTHFRDEATSDWNAFQSTNKSDYVRSWQAFLQRSGFLPFHQEEGIFGYVTLAGTRLFQEYIRTVEGIEEIGVADGIVGGNTRRHANRWDAAGKKSSWWDDNPSPSADYQRWMNLMNKAKANYQVNPHPVIEAVNGKSKIGDTRKLGDWQWNPEDIHLIGIRREQEARASKRGNDDLFLLLIRGMVFKFYGSTDPKPERTSSGKEPYLVEGQHKYRMAWHKIGDVKKVYKALKPFTGAGVMVFRDRDGSDSLTDADVRSGLEGPNNSINVHWTGSGISNFSAGCQVIAGSSYMNAAEKLIDCSKYASTSYGGLSSGKTRGAYNVLTDLVLAYSPLNENVVWYTLGRDDVLDLDPELGKGWSDMMVKNMKGS